MLLNVLAEQAEHKLSNTVVSIVVITIFKLCGCQLL